jgi:glycosyltransferase involved in cell wall biosynthesis
MNNPLISIITVVYNGAATLEQTMLSVINQTYKNIEYIIIDEGSIKNDIALFVTIICR